MKKSGARAIRGGDALAFPGDLAASARASAPPETRASTLGFRYVIPGAGK
jgi:hypothetical protein